MESGICPRCGRALVKRHDGLCCPGCGETPNDCRRCSRVVIEDEGRFFRFIRITDAGDIEAVEV